jgi:Tfp pilus assembly protein PilV
MLVASFSPVHLLIALVILAAIVVGVVFLVRAIRRSRNAKIAAEVRRQLGDEPYTKD